MIWVYGGILLMTCLLLIRSRRFRRSFFRQLNTMLCKPQYRKKHPLRVLYPLAGMLLTLLERIRGKGSDQKLTFLMRSLYVKENVEQETYLYQLQKIAMILAVIVGGCIMGMLLCLSEMDSKDVHVLQRGDYGQDTVNYELDLEYRHRQDTVTVPVEAVRYSESEIEELFENAYEEVNHIMLDENEDQEHVTRPLKLIREYEGIAIYWEVEDPAAVGYNGQLKKELNEGEELVCNLYASFSLDGVTRIFNYPVRICGVSPSEQEYLLACIQDAIEQENDIHKREVKLPDEIEGYAIRFFRDGGSTGAVFLILAIVAAVMIALFYERKLQDRLKKRQEQMMMDFSEIVSKLSLLYEAGLSIHGAFARILEDYENKLNRSGKDVSPSHENYHFAYREMKLALEKIRSGESEGEAYAGFGKRCALQPYIKLGNLLEQNLNKGAKGMQELLLKEVQDAQEARRRIARKKGEEASTRLLIPMVLMLMVVIAIITVPALISISG